MDSENMEKIVEKMIKVLSNMEEVNIRNMSDKELIELNAAWGRSICYSYNINDFRSRQKFGSYPADVSLELLKAVRKKLRDNQLCDTNQVIASIVKRGCQNLANFIEIEYSDEILNRTYENISNLPNDLQSSIQNLLDKTEFNDEKGYFKPTNEECEICIRAITNAIDFCFFSSLKKVIDNALWKDIMSESPEIDILCFKDYPFLCEGEPCNRTHIATDMTHYQVVDGNVVDFT